MGQHVYVNHFASENQGRVNPAFATRKIVVSLGKFPANGHKESRVFMLGYSGRVPADTLITRKMVEAGMTVPGIQFPRRAKTATTESASA